MKKKILTILVSMLFLTTIPSVMGVNSESEDKEPCLELTRTFFKGIVLFPHYSDKNLTFFAVWVFYIIVSPSYSYQGRIILKWVITRYSAYMGRIMEGRLGFFGYIFGFFPGGFDIGR